MVLFPRQSRRRISNNNTDGLKRPKKKTFFLVKVLPFALFVWYTVWISQSLEQTLTQQHLKFNGRVLVCVTGQVERLILRKKVETLLVPLQKKYGFVVDVVLALTEGDSHYTNPENGKVSVPEFNSYSSAVSYLENHDEFFRVFSKTSIPPLSDTSVNPQYLSQMDKGSMSSEWQMNRVENHARQYHALAQCSKSLLEHGGSFDQYEFIVRIRDDAVLERPMSHLKPLLRLLGKNTIVTSDCRTHGGINDRMALVSPSIAREYFERPLENFPSRPIHAKVHNPESYLYYTYQDPPTGGDAPNQIPMSIVQTSLLRGIVKYITNQNGEAVPSSKEEIAYCPTKVSNFLDLFRSEHEWK